MKKSIKQKTSSKNNIFSSLAKVLKYAKGYYLHLITAIIAVTIGVVLELLGPNELSKITNLIKEGFINGIDISAVTSIAIFLVIIYVVMGIMYLIEGMLVAHVTQKVTKRLRTNISNKINNLPLKTLDKSTKGDILSRITNDADTIGQALNNSTSGVVASIVLFCGSVIMMFVHSWIMALSGIAASIIGFALVSIILKKSQKHFNARQQRLGLLNGHIEEAFTNHNTIVVCNAKSQEFNKFNKLNKDLFDSDFKSQFLSGIMHPLMGFVGNLGFVVVCNQWYD